MADEVMEGPAHASMASVPRRLQRSTGPATELADTVPASVDRVLEGPGRPLEPDLLQEMEQRFGHDFSRVRVHTGAPAEQSARDVYARAYTVGYNIVFAAGRFAPMALEGRRLIAHELTHVVQQEKAKAVDGRISGGRDWTPSALGTTEVARSVNAGSSPTRLQREPDERKTDKDLGALSSPYPEEEDVLRHAIKVMAGRKLSQGVVFYVADYWEATGVSGNTFAVGPLPSDMGAFYYVYKLANSDEKTGTETFTRGSHFAEWGSNRITTEVYEKLSKVEGRTQVRIKRSGPAFTDPRDSLAFMIAVWATRGQLNTDHLPQGVAAIPPLPITDQQRMQLKTTLSGPTAAAMVRGLQVVQTTGAAAQTAAGTTGAGTATTTLARGTGTFAAVGEEAAGGGRLLRREPAPRLDGSPQ